MGHRSHPNKYVSDPNVELQYNVAMENQRPIVAAVWASEMGARIRYDLEFYHWWLRARRCHCDACRWERGEREDRRDDRRERRSERRERRSERRERRSIRRERRAERREERRRQQAGEVAAEGGEPVAEGEPSDAGSDPGSPESHSGSASEGSQGHA